MTVSRYGCCLPLPQPLQPHQPIRIRRVGTNEMAMGFVVAPMGVQAEGHLYGVETEHSCEALWGIRFSSSFYQKLLDTLHDGVYFVNQQRQITYWNEGAERLSGYAPGEAIGKGCCDKILEHIDENGKSLCSDGCPLSGVMRDGRPRAAEFYLRHKLGHRLPVAVRVFPMRNSDGVFVGAVEVFSDSTAKMKFEKRVSDPEQLAFRDAVTGLPNRRHIELKVEQALQDHQRLGRLYGLLLFDLDRFRKIDDTQGREVGDSLLKAVGESVAGGLRPVDIVGRWSEEEFLVLSPDMDAVGLRDLAERCRVLVAESSVASGSSRVSVTASIGATVLCDGDNAASAIARADGLMYESRRTGGDRTSAG